MATLWDFVHGVLPFHVFIVYLVVIDIIGLKELEYKVKKLKYKKF